MKTQFLLSGTETMGVKDDMIAAITLPITKVYKLDDPATFDYEDDLTYVITGVYTVDANSKVLCFHGFDVCDWADRRLMGYSPLTIAELKSVLEQYKDYSACIETGTKPFPLRDCGDDGSNIGVGSLVKRLRDKQEAERRRNKHSKKKDRQHVEDDTFDDGYTPDEADVKIGDKEEQAFEYKNVVSLQSVVDGTAGVDQQQPQRNLLMYLRSVRDIDKEIGIAYLDVVDFDPSILDLE